MSGFGNFGSPSGSGLFGSKPPDQPTGFNIPKTSAVTTTPGAIKSSTFGTVNAGGLFNVQQQSSPQTTFTTNFGIKTTTTTPGTSNFTFGSSTPNKTLPAFGASVPAFGSPAGATSAFGISTTNTTVPTFSVPTTQNTTSSKLTFGTSSPSTFNTSGLNALTPKTTTMTFSSITTTAASTPTFNFGVSTTTTTTTTSAGMLSFGTPTSSITTSVTTSSLPPTLSFGIQPAGNLAPTTSTAIITSSTAITTTSSSGFTFTKPFVSTTTNTLTFGTSKTTGGFTFGTTTTTTTTTKNLTFNLGTSSALTPTGLFGSQKTDSLTITTTTTSVGLGGIDKAQTTQGLSGSGTVEPKQAKDHVLPDPILQTLNDFQNFTKQQKSISVEISHGSSKPLKKVQEDLEAIESLLTTITSGLTKNAIAVDKLKTETAQGLHQAEMAQRNHETPPGLDYDNSEPSDYFNDLVTKFETDTVRLRVQMEASEKHLTSLTQCSTISPQELTLAMRRLHETLIVLAARVQALHTTVQSQKEQFKNLRRVYLKDDTNIFESESDQSRMKKKMFYSLRSLTGPTPFSETPGMGHPLNVDGLAMLASSTPAPNNAAAAVTSTPNTSSNPSIMPSWQKPNYLELSTPNAMCSFQKTDVLGLKSGTLPPGNKRSKR